MAKISQRQVLAEVLPVSSTGVVDSTVGRTWSLTGRQYFAQVSGGEVQSSVEKVYDGGSTFPQVLPSVIEVGDVTVTRHFDPTEDGGVIDYYRDKVGKQRFRIDIKYTDADGNVISTSKTRQYTDCILVNITEPEGDSSSGGPATFSLTFSVGKVTNA